jgi:hypothetical protein
VYAEAKGIRIDGGASSSQCKPKLLKFYNRKSKTSKFSKMDVSLIAEAVSKINAPSNESLVFGMKPHESEIASVVVKKPSSAKGLL